jgi:hypothetical protein
MKKTVGSPRLRQEGDQEGGAEKEGRKEEGQEEVARTGVVLIGLRRRLPDVLTELRGPYLRRPPKLVDYAPRFGGARRVPPPLA